MVFCLTIEEKNKFKQALKNREIDPEKLSNMTSAERRAFIAKYVGEENAVQVNSLFESKLLLKNQKAGYIGWAKKVAGITPEVRRDLISKIERLDKALEPREEEAFLEDLVRTRLGLTITEEEANTVFELTKKINTLKEKANKEGIFPSEKERLEYGAAKVALEKYINEIKLKANHVSFRESPPKKFLELIKEIPGTMKSIATSLDNSFWGRQGIKTLLDIRTSPIWFKNFLKSWIDISKQLVGYDVIDSIKADIYSRPNALNGKYEVGGYGLTVLSEEAYPSSLPEKIPLLGRLFKASEAAYNGGALRLRADLADRLIRVAEKQGVNTLDKTEAQGIGHLVGSLTGRGSIGKAEPLSKEINVVLFSVKFMKSNLDILTAGLTDKKIRSSKFARKEAAKSLLGILATLATVLTIAKLIDKDSVDEDPRSSNFGKIKLFGHWRDISGGMASFITLAARLAPTYHNGKLSHWKKTSTGNWIDLSEGKFGTQTAWDIVVESLFTDKLSPFASFFRDYLKGEFFSGEPFTLEEAFNKYTKPISYQNYEEFLKDPNSSLILGDIILEGLGFSSSVYIPKTDWEKSTSAEIQAFRKKVGEAQFKKANEDYNRVYNWWYNTTTQKDSYKKLSNEGKRQLQTEAKNKIKQMIFKANNFKYKTPKKTTEQKQEEKEIKNLLP